jgi:dipeptidase
LPEAFSHGSPQELEDDSARRITEVDILPTSGPVERESPALIERLDEQGREPPVDQAVQEVAKHLVWDADLVLRTWRRPSRRIIAKYADGYLNMPDPQPPVVDPVTGEPVVPVAVDLGHPASWLARSDYADGPTTYAMPARTHDPTR